MNTVAAKSVYYTLIRHQLRANTSKIAAWFESLEFFETATFEYFEVPLLKTIQEENAVKMSLLEDVRTFFKDSVSSISKSVRGIGISGYTATNRLLTLYTENRKSGLKFARTEAALYAWTGIINSTLRYIDYNRKSTSSTGT